MVVEVNTQFRFHIELILIVADHVRYGYTEGWQLHRGMFRIEFGQIGRR